MPLSEHEQRMLDEMERNLYQHDADFVASVSGTRALPNSRFIALGTLIAVAGLAMIVAALVTHLTILGIGGFVVVLGGVVLAMRTTPVAESGRPAAARAPRAGFMDRLNDRWDRRTT